MIAATIEGMPLARRTPSGSTTRFVERVVFGCTIVIAVLDFDENADRTGSVGTDGAAPGEA
jgi:hypothetical protein